MASVSAVPAYMAQGTPIVHPPLLDGDPSLATEILPGPPSVASIQQSMQKRDPKKPIPSYLPTNDPGTTYTGWPAAPAPTVTMPAPEPEGPRRKRARVDRSGALSSPGLSSRPQRASTRSLNALQAPLEPEEPVASSASLGETAVTPPIADPPRLSRRSSAMNVDVDTSVSVGGRTRSSRRDKGKGKEKAAPVFKVKEEEVAISLSMPLTVATPPRQANEDHCSSCRSIGSLIYCDSCPRAFHLWCLNPPMEPHETPEGGWYCPSCTLSQSPPPKAHAGFMSPLIQQVQSTMPAEFQLPEDIRGFFRDVGTGLQGTYIDNSETKQPRLNRLGQLDDRDAFRLKDRNGSPVLCFQCGLSALPVGSSISSSSSKRPRRSTTKLNNLEKWRSIVSCDYCSLHWHLDCLDPPLAALPSFGKKWMCPNHADRVVRPARRVPRQNNPPIEVTKPKQFNNGNIEIVNSERSAPPPPKVPVDEVMINGRRYRVPERVIMLDFWGKLSKEREEPDDLDIDAISTMSSLTSLSSDEEMEDPTPAPISKPKSRGPKTYALDDIMAAQMLCGLTIGAAKAHATSSLSSARHMISEGIQTVPGGNETPHKKADKMKAPTLHVPPRSSIPSTSTDSRGRGRARETLTSTSASTSGIKRPAAKSSSPVKPRRVTASSSTSTTKGSSSTSMSDLTSSTSAEPAVPKASKTNKGSAAAATSPVIKTEPLPSLKIRLPRPGSLSMANGSASSSNAVNGSPQRVAAQKSNEGRPRRNARRRNSESTSASAPTALGAKSLPMNGTSPA